MKKKVIIKIYLVDIREELMTIAPDPNPDEAFLFAWEWWKDRCICKRSRNHQFFYDCIKRGWMRKTDAELFCNFLNQDHFWRCLA